MPRPTTDITDDYLQSHCTIIARDENDIPTTYLLDLWAFEYEEGQRGRLGFKKSPGTNIGSFLLTREQITTLAEVLAESRGWIATPTTWFKGKSLEPDVEPEKET